MFILFKMKAAVGAFLSILCPFKMFFEHHPLYSYVPIDSLKNVGELLFAAS